MSNGILCILHYIGTEFQVRYNNCGPWYWLFCHELFCHMQILKYDMFIGYLHVSNNGTIFNEYSNGWYVDILWML